MKKFLFEIDGIKYKINKKQLNYLKRLVWSEDHTVTDFSVELHKEVYLSVMHKFNILPLDVENDR